MASISPPQASNGRIMDVYVGIGGASSTGKSTMAKMLNFLFDPAHNPLFLAKPTMLHMDDFFVSNDESPRCEFTPADEGDMHVCGLQGTPTRNMEKVPARNRDCLDAIQWKEFREALDGFATKAESSASEDPAVQADVCRAYSEDIHRAIEEAGELMRSRVAGIEQKFELALGAAGASQGQDYQGTYFRLRKGDAATEDSPSVYCAARIHIVEGFLLFADLSPTATSIDQTALETQIQQRQAIHDRFDVRLFLSASSKEDILDGKDVVMARRFARPDYVDVAKGGRRQGGQLWKCKGYFGDIGCKEYVENHKYLFGGKISSPIEGIEVRAGSHTPQANFLWAVGEVFDRLEAMEDKARSEWQESAEEVH